MHKQSQDKMDKEVLVVKYSFQDKLGQMAKIQINPHKDLPQALDKMGPAVANLDLAKLHKDLKVVQINQGQVSQIMVGKVASLKWPQSWQDLLKSILQLTHPVQDQVLHQVQALALGQTTKDKMVRMAKMAKIKIQSVAAKAEKMIV